MPLTTTATLLLSIPLTTTARLPNCKAALLKFLANYLVLPVHTRHQLTMQAPHNNSNRASACVLDICTDFIVLRQYLVQLWMLQMCQNVIWACYMNEYFKFRRIMNVEPIVIVIVIVIVAHLGTESAHVSDKILEHRSEHVTTAQKATHNQRHTTKPYHGSVRPLGSVGFRSVVPLGSVGFRCSFGFRWSRYSVDTLFRWVSLFRWYRWFPLFRWVPLVSLVSVVLLVPLFRWAPLFHWFPLFCWVPLFLCFVGCRCSHTNRPQPVTTATQHSITQQNN